jgi:DNA-binding IclR family transcriptional regulator
VASTNRSVERAIRLLRHLADIPGPVRFTELQVATGIPKGTLHGLLASLEAADFVRHTPHGYEIGIGVFEVGTAVRAPVSLRAAASPLLDDLFTSHGEACHFGLLSQGDVVYLDVRESVHALRFTQRTGARKPAYSTALGKAMLALQTDAAIAATYPSRLPSLTANTIPTRAGLMECVKQVRKNGYATESEESTPGVCCIGVAGTLSSLIYGLSITVPVQRAQVEDLPGFLPSLTTTISRLNSSLTTREWFTPGSLAKSAENLATSW